MEKINKSPPPPRLKQHSGILITLSLLLPLCRQDTLSQLTIQPELHTNKWFSAFLGQFAPWLWPGEHVTDTSLGQPQYLKWSNQEWHVNTLAVEMGGI